MLLVPTYFILFALCFEFLDTPQIPIESALLASMAKRKIARRVRVASWDQKGLINEGPLRPGPVSPHARRY